LVSIDKSNREHIDKFHKQNYLAMLVSWVILAPTWTITTPYFQHYILALGGNEYIVGLIAAISGYTLATVRLIGGYLTDVIGRKKVIVLFTYVLSFTYILFYLAWDWKIVLIASFLSSLALIYQPALNAIIADSLPKEYRGRGLGVINFANGVTGLLAIYVAIYLISTYGILGGVRWGFLISFILILIAAIIRMVFLKETIRVQSLNEVNVISDFIDDYKYAFRWLVKHLIAVVLVAFLFNIVSGITYLLPLYITYYLELGEEFWGYFYMFIFGIQLMLSIPSGFIVDKVGRKFSMITSALFLTLGNLFLFIIGTNRYIIVNPVIHLLLTGVLLGASGALFSLATQSLLADLTVPTVRGKISAIFGFIMNLGLSTGQLISGIIYSSAMPYSIFLIGALISVLCLIYSLIQIKEVK